MHSLLLTETAGTDQGAKRGPAALRRLREGLFWGHLPLMGSLPTHPFQREALFTPSSFRYVVKGSVLTCEP